MQNYKGIYWEHMLHRNNLMLKANLEHIAEYAAFLAQNLPDDGDVPDWIKDKVSRIRENMSSVKHFLQYFDEQALWQEPDPSGGYLEVYRGPNGQLMKRKA